jgi:hypothetical protein
MNNADTKYCTSWWVTVVSWFISYHFSFRGSLGVDLFGILVVLGKVILVLCRIWGRSIFVFLQSLSFTSVWYGILWYGYKVFGVSLITDTPLLPLENLELCKIVLCFSTIGFKCL